MDEQPVKRFEVQVDKGDYRSELFELERVTTFRVVELTSGITRLELQGEMNASLDPDTGSWGNPFYGVTELKLIDDGRNALVTYHDGHAETLPIP
jgi:hypothetical protein